jgi:hypothetical protein
MPVELVEQASLRDRLDEGPHSRLGRSDTVKVAAGRGADERPSTDSSEPTPRAIRGIGSATHMPGIGH